MTSNNPIFEWLQSPENPKLLILMRGISGSGKSTRARELATEHNCHDRLFASDDYFGQTREEYVANWSRPKLSAAHKACQKNVKIVMQRQLTPVIVDNTHVRIADMLPYFDLAVQYEYRVQIEEPTSPWWKEQIAPYLDDKIRNAKQIKEAAKLLHKINKQTHCVPLSSIEKMLGQWMHNVTFDDLVRCYTRYLENPVDPLNDIEVS